LIKYQSNDKENTYSVEKKKRGIFLILYKLIAFFFSTVLISASVQAAKTYDFSTSIAGDNAFAYEGISSSDLTSNNTFPSVEHTDSEYSDISVNDGDFNTISTSTKNTYPMLRYLFELDETETGIEQLSFLWNGKGTNEHNGKNDGVVLYLWSYKNGNYEQIATSGDTSSEINLTYTLTENIIDYIDENNNNSLILLVVSNDKTKKNNDNEISADYVSIEVNFSVLEPLAEYRFEEINWDSGSTPIIDSSGNGYHASVGNNSVPETASPALSNDPGTCGYANQDDGSIRVTGLPLDTSTVGVKTTVTFWMNWDGTENSMPIGWNLHDIWLVNGSMGFNTANSDIYGISSAGLANGWHHVAVEFTNGSVTSNRMHIDGIEQVLTQRLSSPNNSRSFVGSELRIGGWTNDRNYDFTGLMDEVRVYESALSTAQIETIMDERHPCSTFSTKPIVEYRFDECSYTGIGNDVFDQITNAHGSSNGLFSPIDEAIINTSLDLSVNNTSDWVSVPSSVVNGLDNFSVSVWFKTSVNKSQQEIFQALGDSPSDDELEIYLKDNASVILKLKGTSHQFNSNVVLTDGNWHQLIITRVNENACLFIDGSEQQCLTSVNVGSLLVDSANAIVIGQEQDSFGGSFSTSQNFVGQLDEFKIFNITLSDNNIDIIYQNELAGNNYDGSSRNVVQCENTCGLIPGQLSAVGIKIGSGGSDTQINTTTEALAIHAAWLNAGLPESGNIDNGTYNITASGSSNVDRIDFGGSVHDFSGTLPYPGFNDGVNGSHFLVHTSGTLSLPAGTYTIFVEADDGFSFTMDSLSGDTVSFTKFGSSSSGATNELRFENPTGNSNTGGYFTLNQDSVFDIAAIFFERDGGDYLEISISNDARTNAAPSGYEILRDGALGGKVQFGLCPNTSQIDHYQIIHDGQGLTCDAETVTINACTNTYDGSCTLSDEPVTLNVNTTGSSTVTDSISFTGSGTASIPYTIAETTVLSIGNPSIVAKNPDVCFDGSTTNCNLVFSDAGFRFLNGSSGTSEIITNQIAGTTFPLRIEAVKNNNGVCEGLFTNNKDINLSQENIVPGGTDGLSFTINGNDIAKHTSFTSTTLDFETDSIATFPTPIYHDAGQIRLHASYDVGGVSLTGSSNAFWVRPAKLVVNETSGTTHIAGEVFDLTVTAYNSQDVITPNYLPGQIEFKLERTGPTSNGVEGELTYGSGGFITSELGVLPPPTFKPVILDNIIVDNNVKPGVFGTSAAQYSEVGLINLDVQDSNYGSGITVDAEAINIGRFTPAYFEQTVMQGSLHANHGASTTCPSQMWAYSGQLDSNGSGIIRYEAEPILIITPYNANDVATKNYIGDFDKLVVSSISLGGTPITHDLALTSDVSTNGELSNRGDGVNEFTLSDTHRFTYTRNNLSETSPFIANFEIPVDSIIDGDSIAIKPTDTSVTPNIVFFENPLFSEVLSNSLTVKFGRWIVENTYGPETAGLSIPMSAQYWNGTKFITNTDDNCSIISTESDEMTLTDGSLSASSTQENEISSLLTNGFSRIIELDAPTPDQGDVNIEFSVPTWLKYDWPITGTGDKTFDDNPKSVATFGVFRGNDRIISWREIGN
jgi:MSHA biogenesis protein MshQ